MDMKFDKAFIKGLFSKDEENKALFLSPLISVALLIVTVIGMHFMFSFLDEKDSLGVGELQLFAAMFLGGINAIFTAISIAAFIAKKVFIDNDGAKQNYTVEEIYKLFTAAVFPTLIIMMLPMFMLGKGSDQVLTFGDILISAPLIMLGAAVAFSFTKFGIVSSNYFCKSQKEAGQKEML